MKKYTRYAFLAVLCNPAFAGEGENIAACVVAAKEYAGEALDGFRASYDGNMMSMSIVKWHNAFCEVKLGDVYNLEVNGANYVYQDYAGKESYELYNSLDADTDSTVKELIKRIEIIRSHIRLLKHRLEEAKIQLQGPRPNHAELKEYISEGISTALSRSDSLVEK